MLRSLASRCLTATVIATVLIGIMMVAPVAAADPRTQDGPRPADQNWTGVSSDKGVEKSAPVPGDVSAPGHDNATDVPGQVVRTPAELSGPIVTPAGPSASEIVRIRTAIAANGKARVNVTTTVPRGLTARDAATDATASKVKGALDGLRDRVRSSGARELGRITVYPWATYSVTAAGLNALLADPNVTSVTLDAPVKLALDSSTNIVKSTQLNAAGTRGNGYARQPGRSVTGRHHRLRGRQRPRRIRRQGRQRGVLLRRCELPRRRHLDKRSRYGRELHVRRSMRARHPHGLHRGRPHLHGRPRRRRARCPDRPDPGRIALGDGLDGDALRHQQRAPVREQPQDRRREHRRRQPQSPHPRLHAHRGVRRGER